MRASASHRLIAAAIALLWAALPVALGAHSAQEQHGYCAEHERIEHGVTTDTAIGAHAAPRDSVAQGSRDELPPHDWCPLAEALAGHAASCVESPPGIVPAPAIAAETVAIAEQAVVVVPILRLAPKSSPPSLAV